MLDEGINVVWDPGMNARLARAWLAEHTATPARTGPIGTAATTHAPRTMPQKIMQRILRLLKVKMMEHGLQTTLRQDLHLFYIRIRLPDQPYHRFALSTITTPRPTTPRPRPPRLRPTTPTPPTPRRALPRTRHRPKNTLYKVPFLALPTGRTTTMSRLTTGPPTTTTYGPRANQRGSLTPSRRPS